MGWRFRKSVRIIPGIRLNFSKSGISTTVGIRGASVNFSSKGTYVNTGIPGTGLYRREKIPNNNSDYDYANNVDSNTTDTSSNIQKGTKTTKSISQRIRNLFIKNHSSTQNSNDSHEENIGHAQCNTNIDANADNDRITPIQPDMTSNCLKNNDNKHIVDFGTIIEGSDSVVTRHMDPFTNSIQNSISNTLYDPKRDLEFYKYPPLSLLDKYDDTTQSIDIDELNANKERIIQVLHSFGFEICSIKLTIGPKNSLYEITPAEGINISRIYNYKKDIALYLAANNISITPISNKGTIGIELENRNKYIVNIESILNSSTFQESKMELPCALGKTITNDVFMVDLTKTPNLLISGATGQGKSVCLNTIIISLLYKKHPSELKFVLIDPKKVEFSIYTYIENHFLSKLAVEEEPIITSAPQMVNTLNALCRLVDIRYKLMNQAFVRNINEYNELFKSRKLNPMLGHDYMPYYVVIIDSYERIIDGYEKKVIPLLSKLVHSSRAVGIHLIISTSHPINAILPGDIKSYIPARISFRVPERIDSQVILDCDGAEKLLGCGDMLYLNGGEPIRVQCAFSKTSEVSRICKYISSQQGYAHAAYLPEFDIDGVCSSSCDDGEPIRCLDPMFEQCARYIILTQQGSTSMLQRTFTIGYNRAGKIMDQMEKAGIVGPQIGARPRDVLVKDLNALAKIINSYR